MLQSKNFKTFLIFLCVIEAIFIFWFLYNNKILNQENILLKKQIRTFSQDEKEIKDRVEPTNLVYTLFIEEAGPFASGFVTYPAKTIILKIVNQSTDDVSFESTALKIDKTEIKSQETKEIKISTPPKTGEYEYKIEKSNESFEGKIVIQ